MNYKEKYLKYKLKYLNLKKMHGGMYSIVDALKDTLLLEINSKNFKNSYSIYLKNMKPNDFSDYVDLFDTQYFSGTLGYFNNDNICLNKQQDRLLEYSNEDDINELKKKILDDTRRFKDITSHVLSEQNQEISNTEIITYMDGNTSDPENQDPRNPELL